MRYFSMFSGIGGFEYGIERVTKWECVGFSEIDKHSIQTYQKHYPNHKNWGDCKTINPEELPDFDMLCGGFPYQSFSIAGKRKGFQDTRGTLFHEILRIAKAKKPRLLFLENVKGLLSADDGRCFATIISSLDELGYDVEWQVLNSKNFGVPQNRERVFIIGHLRGTGRRQIFPLRQGESIPAEERESEANEVARCLTNTMNKRGKGSHINLLQNSGKEIARVYDVNGLSPTLKGKTGGWQEPKIAQAIQTDGMLRQGSSFGTNNPQSSRNIRRLTPIECERLQGFPDGWTEGVSDTQRYKQLGNAVTTNVIEAIAESIFRLLA